MTLSGLRVVCPLKLKKINLNNLIDKLYKNLKLNKMNKYIFEII